NVPLNTLIGNLYLGEGDLAAAKGSYQRALELNPRFAVAAANLAWILVQQEEDLDRALSLAQTAKQGLADAASVSDTLGWIMVKKRLYVDAQPLLEDVVQRAPASAQYHYHLAALLAEIGNTDRARTEFEKALELKLAGRDADEARRALARLPQ